MDRTFAVAIGGAAGQGVATPGDIFAKLFARRGLHINAYNAYQSIIRGGHTFLTIRAGAPHEGVQLCPLPLNRLSKGNRSKVEQNTLALAAAVKLMGVAFEPL